MDNSVAAYPARFFMGANTPDGFVAYLDDIYERNGDWRAFLIKGGAGTGKASLMRRVLTHMNERGTESRVLICSSDPDSIDAVIFPNLKVCIIDATAPHIIEPKYWGAVEQIVDISSCMDAQTMHAEADKIIAATDANTALHVRVRRFMGTAAALLGDTRRMAEQHTETGKIIRTAARIAAREFLPPTEQTGRRQRLFLSAVTPAGFITLFGTVQALCPRIYAIEDEYGASAGILIGELCSRAIEAGHNVISCADPLFPSEGPQHLLIPSLGLGFVTSNFWHKVDFPVFRRIHAMRFTNTDALRSCKPLMSFNRRACRELIGEAVSISQEAKRLHDQMEALNRVHVNWDGVNALTEGILAQFDKIIGT